MFATLHRSLLLLALAGSVLAGDLFAEEKAANPRVGLKEMNWKGVEKLVASHKGRVVVVDVWTTTCPTCLKKFPEFLALRKTHGKQVTLITVNCDYDGIADKPTKYYRADVLKFLRKQKATCENVMLTIPFLPFLNQIKLESMPAIFVYDKTGKLVKRFDNDNAVKEADEFTMRQVDTLITKLVKGK